MLFRSGTTRDAVREAIQIDGVPLMVVDTAGLRSAMDEVERLGIERTRFELERADIVLEVFDASNVQSALPSLPAGGTRIAVYNKTDLAPQFNVPATEPVAVAVSAKTGAGLDSLRSAILNAAGWSAGGEPVFLARERHLRALKGALQHLKRAAAEIERWELFAEELRLGQLSLGSITGEFTADDLLGEIFSRFCIGK